MHEQYMQRCLDLAALGTGKVSPNPMVGAVIVCDGSIVGEGYHEHYGHAHAEVNAVAAVLGNRPDGEAVLRNSTLYVSLEPCAHFGKTPPCTELILRHGIPRVVIGCLDPFPEVDGKGAARLRDAGVEVVSGVLEADCRWLNRRFFTRIEQQRPYVILKWAQTGDGFFAPEIPERFWITGSEAQRIVHRWRTEEDAVLVGKRTAEIDNPRLNARYWPGRSPKRVVIDRRLELPEHLHLFDQSVETLIFNELKSGIEGRLKFIALEDFDRFVPHYLLYQLYLQDLQSVIIEGGAATLNSFIEAGLWDEARIFTGAGKLRNGLLSPCSGVKGERCLIGPDFLEVVYNPAGPWDAGGGDTGRK